MQYSANNEFHLWYDSNNWHRPSRINSNSHWKCIYRFIKWHTISTWLSKQYCTIFGLLLSHKLVTPFRSERGLVLIWISQWQEQQKKQMSIWLILSRGLSAFFARELTQKNMGSWFLMQDTDWHQQQTHQVTQTIANGTILTSRWNIVQN